jgi:hypothetical protein
MFLSECPLACRGGSLGVILHPGYGQIESQYKLEALASKSRMKTSERIHSLACPARILLNTGLLIERRLISSQPET